MAFYGSAEQVGSLTPRYSGKTGAFGGDTQPTVTTVERLLTQVSAIVDSMLAKEGFTTPVTNTTTLNAITLFVVEEVAAIVEGVNGSGRFGPTTKSAGNRGRFALIMDDCQAFISVNATGFESAGAGRSGSTLGQIAYRDTDESGSEVVPLFQRKAFGDVTINWDE